MSIVSGRIAGPAGPALVIVVAAALIGLGVPLNTAGAASPRNSRSILLDQSHEYLFAVDHLGGVLYESGYDVTVSRDVFPPDDLDAFDVLLLHQSSVSIDYDARSLTRIRQFVLEGGGLYLMANPLASFAGRDYPIEKVADLFGVRLERTPGQPPLTTVSEAFFGNAFELTRLHAHPVGVMTIGRQSDPQLRGAGVMATDAGGSAVLLLLQYGGGRVVITTDHSLLRNPSFERSTPQTQRQREFIVRLFDWLARLDQRNDSPAKPRRGLQMRTPRAVLERNGLVVAYTPPLRDGAEYILAAYDRFYAAMKDFFQCEPRRPLRLEALATGGGAFTSFPLLGIGVLTGDRAVLDGFLLWEMTNAWPLPMAPSFTEAWATFVGSELGARLGVMSAEQAKRDIASHKVIIQADDPDFTRFDISIPDPDKTYPGKPQRDFNWNHFRMLKCALVLRELYERYGIDMFRRLVRIHRAEHGASTFMTTPDFDSYVREMSLAAGEDLTQFFKSYGATVGDIGLPKDPGAIAAMADSIIEQEAKRQAAEAEGWAEFSRLRTLLADDSWVSQWVMSDNLCGSTAADAWVENLTAPPEKFSYLTFPEDPRRLPADPPRRGFLVVHPRERTVPCKLIRTVTVPQSATTRLLIGGMRRLTGDRVVLRLFVNDQRQWEKPLLEDGVLFHDSVDLSGYAGQTVKLRLEADTEGEWYCREALLDYMIVQTSAPGNN